MWTGCVSPGWGAFSNSCKRGYENSNSIDGGELRDNFFKKELRVRRG